ncbi:hypothetical protein TNCV_1703391 [Trichonephila clavipes]|nr:hypothetical protein TNCV_1703391 [Trichonephila clavipes]
MLPALYFLGMHGLYSPYHCPSLCSKSLRERCWETEVQSVHCEYQGRFEYEGEWMSTHVATEQCPPKMRSQVTFLSPLWCPVPAIRKGTRVIREFPESPLSLPHSRRWKSDGKFSNKDKCSKYCDTFHGLGPPIFEDGKGLRMVPKTHRRFLLPLNHGEIAIQDIALNQNT